MDNHVQLITFLQFYVDIRRLIFEYVCESSCLQLSLDQFTRLEKKICLLKKPQSFYEENTIYITRDFRRYKIVRICYDSHLDHFVTRLLTLLFHFWSQKKRVISSLLLLISHDSVHPALHLLSKDVNVDFVNTALQEFHQELSNLLFCIFVYGVCKFPHLSICFTAENQDSNTMYYHLCVKTQSCLCEMDSLLPLL